MVSRGVMMMSRSTVLRSSRTFPFQRAFCMNSSAACVKRCGPPIVLAAEKIREVPDERGNVVAAVPQGRHPDRDDAQPEVEVLAEGALLDLLLEILVGRGDDPDVHLDRPRRSEPLDLPLLEHAQHLGLRLRAHVADLVEEDRSLVRLLELADLLFGGASERALLVAEELGLDQLLRDRGAVDLHEPLAAAQAVAMNGAGDELLADAALAEQQHRGIGRRGALDRVPHLPQRAALPDHLMTRLDGALQRAVLVSQPRLIEDVPDGDQQPLGAERLLDEIDRAAPRGVGADGRRCRARKSSRRAASRPAP